MSHLSRFENRHAGERCFLVCNGPSLNKMDLTPLAGETVIGLNKIYLGLERFGFYPRYLVAVNEKVIVQAAEDLAAMNCVKFIGARGAHAFPEDPLTYHLNTLDPPARFCHDIAKGVREGGTVTYAALQIARYMGFDEVIILGMDHRFQFEGQPNEAKFMQGADPNHFDPSYFGQKNWDNPDLQKSEDSYRIARKMYEAEGRRILDATVDGGCDIFEKVDFLSKISV